MLHSLILCNVVVQVLGLFGQRWENLWGIAIGIATLLSTNKACYLCVSVCNGMGACMFLLVAIMLAVAIFTPGDNQRGLIADMKKQMQAEGLKGGGTAGHVFSFGLLLTVFFNFIFSAKIAYYAYQVYHYPGDVEDLKHGPGLDGQGHVVGENCDDHPLYQA